jgi:hypothetical protein
MVCFEVRYSAQFMLAKSGVLPNVPLATDLASTDNGRRAIEFFAADSVLAWPLVAPPDVPAERAAELYRRLAEEEIRRTTPRGHEYERIFFYAPAEAEASLREWLPGETLLPQEGGDLGARGVTRRATHVTRH